MVDVVDDRAGAVFDTVTDTVMGEAAVVEADVVGVSAVVEVVVDRRAVDETDDDDGDEDDGDEGDEDDDGAEDDEDDDGAEDVAAGGVVVDDVDDSRAANGPVGSDIHIAGGVINRASSRPSRPAVSRWSSPDRLDNRCPDRADDGDAVSIH